MTTRARIVIAAVAAVLAAPAAAQATTTVSLSADGRVLALSGNGDPSDLTVTADGDAVVLRQTFDPAMDTADYFEAGERCVEDGLGTQVHVRCPATDTALRRITGTLGGGVDWVQVFIAFPGGVTLDGGDGDDFLDAYSGSGTATHAATLTGGEGADSLEGDDGDDELDGGAGGDSLRGRGGADSLRGGPAGDTLTGEAGADELLGGDDADGSCRAAPERRPAVRRGRRRRADRRGGRRPRSTAAQGTTCSRPTPPPRCRRRAPTTIIGGAGIDGMGYQRRVATS